MERQPGIETGVFMYKEGNLMITITELFCFQTFEIRIQFKCFIRITSESFYFLLRRFC